MHPSVESAKIATSAASNGRSMGDSGWQSFRFSLALGETMLRLAARQRTMLIEKVPDVANLTLASTFLGQFLGEGPFSVAVAIPGIGAWIVIMVIALVLAEDERP